VLCCCGLTLHTHVQMYRLLWGGLVSLGLQPFVEAEEDRLATVNTIKVGNILETAEAYACRHGNSESFPICNVAERHFRVSMSASDWRLLGCSSRAVDISYLACPVDRMS
jgi:hypothetical protein